MALCDTDTALLLNFHAFYGFLHWYVVFQGSEDELQLILLDTVQLCGNTGMDYMNDQPKGITQ